LSVTNFSELDGDCENEWIQKLQLLLSNSRWRDMGCHHSSKEANITFLLLALTSHCLDRMIVSPYQLTSTLRFEQITFVVRRDSAICIQQIGAEAQTISSVDKL
jgi:hypothetical protein